MKIKKDSYILAIDLGSTNLKVALFDNDLNKISESTIPLKYSVKSTERIEFDPEDTWNSIIKLIKKTYNIAKIRPEEIKKISICSQTSTFTILDNSGKPIIPFISWLDGRATIESEILSKKFGKDFHYNCSSFLPTSRMLLSKILWIKNNCSYLDSSENIIATFSSFIIFKLIGVNAIDNNLAALDGIYSIKINNWRSDIINYLDIKKSQLPILFDTGTPIKTLKTCNELKLSSDLEVILAGNDQTAGAIGNSCSENKILITLGTALVVYRYIGEKIGPFNSNSVWGPFPENGYYEMFVNKYGTNSLDWAKNHLMPNIDIDTFTFFAKSSITSDINNESSNKRMFFYPDRIGSENAFAGEGDLKAKAGAVFEGISFFLRQIIINYLKIDLTSVSVYVTGGGSKNLFWLQILADVLNTKIFKIDGDALLGTAKMAAPDIVLKERDQEVIVPDVNMSRRYNNLFKFWLKGLSRSS